jgi:hypothetical protein
MNAGAMAQVKFATQLDSRIANDLRRFAAATDRGISGVASAAVAE